MVICLESGAYDLHIMVQLMPVSPRHLLLHYNSEWLRLSGAGSPRLSWKRGCKTDVEVILVICGKMLTNVDGSQHSTAQCLPFLPQ